MTSGRRTPPQHSNFDAHVLVALAVSLCAAVLLELAAPDDVGADFELFRTVSLKALAGQPLYEDTTRTDFTTVRFLYLPHTAFLLAPLAILPFRFGWAVTVGLTILVVLLVGYRWKFDLLKQILSITVLPAVFSMYQGNIDGLLLVLFLLPARLQMVFILTKPQSVGGLAARALRYKEGWLILTLISVMALVFRFQDSFSFLRTAQGFNANIWHRINPLQFVIGATLLLIAIRRSDERLLLICSPFLSPYVTVGSLWPAWIGACAIANRWLLLLGWAFIWLATGWGALAWLLRS